MTATCSTKLDESEISRRLRTCATFVLCTLVALAPLPFGSTTARAIAIDVLALGATVLLLCSGRFQARDARFVQAFAFVASCWLAVVVLQIVPLYGPFTPLAHDIWAETQLLRQETAQYISAVRGDPILAAGPELACGLSLLAGYLIGRCPSSARLLLRTFATSGLLYAVYGILSAIFAPGYVLWLEKVAYRDVLTSTFINANSAAAYFGCCSLCWFLLYIEAAKRVSNWRVFLFEPSRHEMFTLVGFATTLTATFMTGSRAGAAATLLALCGASVISFWRRLTDRLTIGVGAMAILTAVSTIVLLLGGRISDRFNSSGFMDEGRLAAYNATLGIIHDHPWLGTGLGTFRWVFPAYRSDDVTMVGVWDRTHNTTLELASEMGIPLSIVIALGWLALFAVLWRGMVNRRRDQIFSVFAFWGSFLAVLHSQVDFSLQIPGLSIVILTLTGVGIAQSASSRSANPPLLRLDLLKKSQ